MHDVVIAAVIKVFRVIWHSWIMFRSDNRKLFPPFLENLIIANVNFSGTLSEGTSSASIQDFLILKAFSVVGKPRKAHMVIEVIWKTPLGFWVKCNTNGAARGSPGLATYGGIFRDSSAATLGCFMLPLGINYALHAELVGVMVVVEVAYKKGWHRLWLGSDS